MMLDPDCFISVMLIASAACIATAITIMIDSRMRDDDDNL
jgi:hypothetical protein